MNSHNTNIFPQLSIKVISTFSVRESLTHCITYIHTTTDTMFYIGIKTKIVEKWPNQSLLLSRPFSPPPTTNATKHNQHREDRPAVSTADLPNPSRSEI